MTEIIDDWFTEGDKFQQWWFRGKLGDHHDYILDKIKLIEQKYDISNISFWKQNKPLLLSGILFYDQFYRHVQQMKPEYLKIAVDLCIYGIQNNYIPETSNQLVFFLMPLRHTNNRIYYNYCISIIERLSKETPNIYYDKFLKACAKQVVTHDPPDIKLSWLTWIDSYRDVLCDKVQYEYNESSKMLTSTIAWKCFIKFIKNRNLSNNKKTLIISLSGGVDSMVFLYLCKIYQQYNKDFNYAVVHINWNQRDESVRESDFIVKYLEESSIPFLYENVIDISRSEDRKVFELRGKEIRFNLYHRAITEFNGDCIFLGHHSGDIIENVFTNLINGMHMLDLGKMKYLSSINGIMIARPFLEIDKSFIYEIAVNNLVPFFKNTTPGWSNRGHIRGKIFPAIKEQFPSFEKSFLKLSKRSSELGDLVFKSLIDPYLSKITQSDDDGSYCLQFIKEYPVLFYELMFEKFMHSIKKKKISKKAIESWYFHTTNNVNWKPYTLSKNITVQLDDTLDTMFLIIV